MKLFFVSNRPKVLDRWQTLLGDWKPEVIDAKGASASLDKDDIVLLHVSSLSKFDSDLLFSLKQKNPNLILIVCTDAPNETEGVQVLRSGANGYTNTYVTGSLLSEVVKTVLRGDIWAGPELLQKLLRSLLANPPATDSKVDTAESIDCFQGLSSREHEVLAVLLTGASNKEIARELDITERTVKAHLSSMFNKTGISDRVTLALMASKLPAPLESVN